jgi:hypothetical protein
MQASNRTSKPPVKRPERTRGACSPQPGSCDRAHESLVSAEPQTDERVLAEPPTADGLKVTVRVIPLPESESNPLRARQFAVIVDLLRRAVETQAEELNDSHLE